jgi:hypothetical protein
MNRVRLPLLSVVSIERAIARIQHGIALGMNCAAACSLYLVKPMASEESERIFDGPAPVLRMMSSPSDVRVVEQLNVSREFAPA